ncbi:efflux RND transporter periplasmic adaptor subunit [Kordiimonas marina]|uniref:efflux RND transporter periplasmic adaptor subunit n=1 Tax=Kordiimonas marina TaxID=2872312 RepID=UPI001FF64F4E|nr:efflux RND transporter periplasmic adaptor subunit [Kordiimonas marina]MCJ9427937.1 efflux RND transporter periplasmic adaptor subunit [Kordiimonas marina]
MLNTQTEKGVRPRGLMAAALLAAGLMTVPATAQEQPRPALVEVATAHAAMMAPETYVPGTVVSRNDSRIAAQISGQITWVAPEGTLVKTGEPIARIDDRNLKLTLARGKSQVRRLEARLDYLRADLKRQTELAARGSAPASRLEEAQSTLEMTQEELAQARVAVTQAETDLDRATVRAPFPGRVVARLSQIGEYASPGAQIVRLVDTEHLEVSAQAPVTLAALLKDGQAVHLRHDSQVMPTHIRALIPVGDTVSRTLQLRVALPKGAYVVGSAVQVGVPSEAAEHVVAVPRDALVLRREGTYVFRLKGDNTAERVTVSTGAAVGDEVAVAGDIADGDRVVVRGGERLRSGQPVKLKEPISADAAAPTGASL